MNKDITLLTSESVTEGHPDKVCDMISDALLDAYLEEDPSAHVALETMASEDTVFIAGEVASFAKVDVKNKAREVICEIGYDSKEKGIDGKECLIITNIGVQSPDIAQGVTQCNGTIGAGDQGKSQVTVAYNSQGEVLGVTDVVISAQHNAEVSVQKLRMDIEEHVIREVIPKELLLPDVKIHINPTGRFVVGGPAGDVGLTGRKIIVDTYGGIARHGGGAFSGKDPTKVDRSAAYMARYAAKNVVAAGFCKKCEINLAYAIGIPQPVSIKIDTFGTEEIPKEIIEDTVNEVFDFSVAGIINSLSLTKVKYKPVAAYGHFGRTDLDLPWERLDKVKVLQEKAVARVAEEIYKNR